MIDLQSQERTGKLLLRVPEVADTCQVGERTVWRWIEEGVIPHVRIGGVVRIPADALDAWIREQTTEGR